MRLIRLFTLNFGIRLFSLHIPIMRQQSPYSLYSIIVSINRGTQLLAMPGHYQTIYYERKWHNIYKNRFTDLDIFYYYIIFWLIFYFFTTIVSKDENINRAAIHSDTSSSRRMTCKARKDFGPFLALFWSKMLFRPCELNVEFSRMPLKPRLYCLPKLGLALIAFLPFIRIKVCKINLSWKSNIFCPAA